MGPDGANQVLILSLIDMEISQGMMLTATPKPNTGFESSPPVASKGFAAKITALNLYLLI